METTIKTSNIRLSDAIIEAHESGSKISIFGCDCTVTFAHKVVDLHAICDENGVTRRESFTTYAKIMELDK